MAEITWQGAARTYRIGACTFLAGRTLTTDDGELIEYARRTAGFAVRILEMSGDTTSAATPAPASEAAEAPPKRVRRPVN